MGNFQHEDENYVTHEIGAHDLHQLWIANACREGNLKLLLAIREALESDLAKALKRAKRQHRLASKAGSSGDAAPAAPGTATTHTPGPAQPVNTQLPGPADGGPNTLGLRDIQLLIEQIESIFRVFISQNPGLFATDEPDADPAKLAGFNLISAGLDQAEADKRDIVGSGDAPNICRVKAGRGPAKPCIVLYRMQSMAETKAFESSGAVERKEFTERCKWFTEDPAKAAAFSNKGAGASSTQMVAISVDGDFYLEIRKTALQQLDSTSTQGFEDRYIYHREGLAKTSKMINIGVPESRLEEFNAHILDGERV